MTRLKIADRLTLPLDIVTQTVAILAKRRAGKSYTMRRLAEQLFKAGQQIVIVDPKGDQWGIRSAADGKAPGLAVVILGGERGDVPLEVGAGEIVAKLVVEERVSVLLDLSLFRKGEVAKFMTDFMENLYRLKAREIYRTPVMLVVDEADAIAPQKPQPGEERMLGAIEDIVRRGGQRGIGCVLVTQRSAVLNKNVLTQAQILVALRTIAPQDLKAMKEWIDVHGDLEQQKTLMASLPSLPVGEAWFWSPGWPTNDGIFQRVSVLPIETFDSGATPRPGEKRTEPKSAADVDLDALKRQMAATIEKAKADDPRELRKLLSDKDREIKQLRAATSGSSTSNEAAKPVESPKLADLRQQLARHRRALEAAMKILVKVRAVDFPLDTDEDRKALEQAIAAAVRQVTGPIEKRVTRLVAMVDGVKQAAAEAERGIAALLEEKVELAVQVEHRPPFQITNAAAARAVARPAAEAPRVATGPIGDDPRLSSARGVKKHVTTIVAVLAQHPDGLTRDQALILAGYQPSGDISTAFAGLLEHGLIASAGGRFTATAAGITALGPFDPLPTGAALRAQRLNDPKASSAERKILGAVFALHEDRRTPAPRAEIHEIAGLKPSGDTSSAFGKFIRLGWLVERDGGYVPAASFFEG